MEKENQTSEQEVEKKDDEVVEEKEKKDDEVVENETENQEQNVEKKDDDLIEEANRELLITDSEFGKSKTLADQLIRTPYDSALRAKYNGLVAVIDNAVGCFLIAPKINGGRAVLVVKNNDRLLRAQV